MSQGNATQVSGCACDERFRLACAGVGIYAEHEGKHYCVLHLPDKFNKVHHFEAEIAARVEAGNYDFRGFVFPRFPPILEEHEFRALVDFTSAVFNMDPDPEIEEVPPFSKTTFRSDARFHNAYFGTGANFAEAVFEGKADFSEAKFEGPVEFTGRVRFNGEADFLGTRFAAKADFSEARFEAGVNLQGVEFKGDAIFEEAVFYAQDKDSMLDFSGITFHKLAAFGDARFYAETIAFASGDSEDPKASFLSDVYMGATFGGEISGVAYRGDTYFPDIEFPKAASFTGAIFHGAVHFETVTFHGEAGFWDTKFFGPAHFNEKTKFLSGANFIDARFIEGGSAGFVEAEFGAFADFATTNLDEASFWRASFRGVRFSGANLGEVDFRETTFNEGEIFEGSRLIAADFEGSTLRAADFSEAKFHGDTSFVNTTFENRAIFSEAIFTDTIRFFGTETNEVFRPDTVVDFQDTRIDRPDELIFHTVLLRPHWFINVDARNFTFINVKWHNLLNGPRKALDRELEVLQEREVRSPHSLLSKACRELSINAEQNRLYPEASGFNYWAMDARRKEVSGSNFAPWRLVWWYWILSGYGERHIRAFVALCVMAVLFAIAYMPTGIIEVQDPSFFGVLRTLPRSLVYSFEVLTRLNTAISGDATLLGRAFVIAEGVLGPLQIALLALAIRRKFMR
jgi:uncharacterized protein YjbI with pentapeptide repeats